MTDKLFRMAIVLLSAAALAGCAGEGGSEGPEGPEGSGGDGPEGIEGGSGSAPAPFVSSGVSRGTFQSISLDPDESFAGLLHDTEVAVYYDAVLELFTGRLRNEANEAVCDVSVTVTLDGYRTVNTSYSGRPFVLDGLAQYQRDTFEFPAPGATFGNWTVAAETYGCTSAPGPVAGGGEGGEGGGGEGSEGGGGEGSGGEHGGSGGGGEGSGEHGGSGGGGEGGGEHGGSGEGSGGGESGDETSPPIPINQPVAGRFLNQDYRFAYDALHGVFRGTVMNPTGAFVCESRTEIHLGSGGTVIELGPTMPVNLPPGGMLKIVMSADGYVLDMYTLHPESTPCQ